MIDTLFTSRQVIKILGITSPQLEYWLLKNLVEPADPGQGTGTYRQFSLSNLFELAVIRELMNYIRPQNMKILGTILDEYKKKYRSKWEIFKSKYRQVGDLKAMATFYLSIVVVGIHDDNKTIFVKILSRKEYEEFCIEHISSTMILYALPLKRIWNSVYEKVEKDS